MLAGIDDKSKNQLDIALNDEIHLLLLNRIQIKGKIVYVEKHIKSKVDSYWSNSLTFVADSENLKCQVIDILHFSRNNPHILNYQHQPFKQVEIYTSSNNSKQQETQLFPSVIDQPIDRMEMFLNTLNVSKESFKICMKYIIISVIVYAIAIYWL